MPSKFLTKRVLVRFNDMTEMDGVCTGGFEAGILLDDETFIPYTAIQLIVLHWDQADATN